MCQWSDLRFSTSLTNIALSARWTGLVSATNTTLSSADTFDGAYELKLKQPITDLQKGKVTVTVNDLASRQPAPDHPNISGRDRRVAAAPAVSRSRLLTRQTCHLFVSSVRRSQLSRIAIPFFATSEEWNLILTGLGQQKSWTLYAVGARRHLANSYLTHRICQDRIS